MKPSLAGVSATTLTRLAAALRSGRVTAPFGDPQLSRFAGGGTQITRALEALDAAGFSPLQIATLCDAILEDRQSPSETNVQLVISGPESDAVPTRDTRVVLQELFAGAQESVLIAGYAVYGGKRVFETLADRMRDVPDLAVTLLLDIRRARGDTSLESEIVRRFARDFRTSQWPDDRPLPRLVYFPNALSLDHHRRAALHAKCVVIDRAIAFISSANFTEAAQDRNVEAGVLLRDQSLAVRLASHFEALLRAEVFLEARW